MQWMVVSVEIYYRSKCNEVCSSTDGTSISHSSPKLRDHQGRDGRKIVKARGWRESKQNVSSRYGRTKALIDDQQLWLLAQDQASQNSSKEWEWV